MAFFGRKDNEDFPLPGDGDEEKPGFAARYANYLNEAFVAAEYKAKIEPVLEMLMPGSTKQVDISSDDILSADTSRIAKLLKAAKHPEKERGALIAEFAERANMLTGAADTAAAYSANPHLTEPPPGIYGVSTLAEHIEHVGDLFGLAEDHGSKKMKGVPILSAKELADIREAQRALTTLHVMTAEHIDFATLSARFGQATGTIMPDDDSPASETLGAGGAPPPAAEAETPTETLTDLIDQQRADDPQLGRVSGTPRRVRRPRPNE